MPYKDPEKRRLCKNACSARYKKKHKNAVLEGQRRRWRLNKEFIRFEKTKVGCRDCGEKHEAALDFHHIQNKSETIAKMSVYSRERIVREIAKCIVLCSNCHRKRHYAERISSIH